MSISGQNSQKTAISHDDANGSLKRIGRPPSWILKLFFYRLVQLRDVLRHRDLTRPDTSLYQCVAVVIRSVMVGSAVGGRSAVVPRGADHLCRICSVAGRLCRRRVAPAISSTSQTAHQQQIRQRNETRQVSVATGALQS